MELDTEKEDLMLTDYGILVPIKDATIMARGISYFIDNEAFATQCSANSEKRIKAFEKNTILEQYINLIKSTCTNK
jgi:N-acetylgalactosamine-N,N'-diacetylbacillosaminyl-diphospho-undecaprenol 4-alpha-N-acetylgalactosaminyltransferase